MLSDRKKGILSILCATICWTLMSFFVRLSGALPTAEKALFRNLIAMFVSGIFLIKEKPQFKFDRKGIIYVIVRSVAGTIGILCNFYALDRINVSDANILNKMSSFFGLIFSHLLLKERITPTQLLIFITSFLGSLLIIKPTGANAALIPTLISLLGGMMAGLSFTCVRGATKNNISKPLIVFLFSVFSCLLFFPSVLSEYIKPTSSQLLCLFMCGIFGAGGQLCMTYAYSKSPAKDLGVYEYAQVIWSALLGWLFFDQISDILSFTGYALIIAMGIINVRIASHPSN